MIIPNLKNIASNGGNLIKSGYTKISQFIRENPISSGAVVGGSVLAGGLAVSQIIKTRRKKRTKKKTTRKKRRTKKTKRKTKKKKRRGRSTPRTAGKGRDRSTRRIRYTKNRQPYVILKSGKARFIKKSSARRSHKRKGGRY